MLGSVPPGPHPRARPPGYNPERPKNKQQYLRCHGKPERWRCPRCRAARPLREEEGDMFFFSSLCSPCSGRRRNLILPYAPNHLAFSLQRFPTATTTLPRRPTQVRYIYLHSSSIRHMLLDISETLTPSIGPPTLAIRAQYIRLQMTTKPPPRRTGQEATAAPHRAGSHRRAAPGRKPPPRRTGQDATAAPHRARRHRRAAPGQKPPPRRKPRATAAPSPISLIRPSHPRLSRSSFVSPLHP